MLHNELELAASTASLEYMKAEMVELTNSRNERQRAKELLFIKHKKIEDFEKLAVRFLLLLFHLKGLPHYFRRICDILTESEFFTRKISNRYLIGRVITRSIQQG